MPFDALVAVTRQRAISDSLEDHSLKAVPWETLAELQLRILWEELLPRYPIVEVMGDPQRVYSNFIHGIRSLPVRIPR